VPTKVHFGKGQISHLAEEIRAHGSKVLLVYGEGSIKRNGIYAAVTGILNEGGIEYVECGGIVPNPRISSARKGIALCREHGLDVVLAVGGGSVIDISKAIAAGYYYDGDPWDLVLTGHRKMPPFPVERALPIVAVLTIAAAGSEMDPSAVINNEDTWDKLGFGYSPMRPVSVIMDPQYTYSVPRDQTAMGVVDIMSHAMESYFNNVPGAYLQTKISEAVLKTCVRYGMRACEEPRDYEARANLMWASSWAINSMIARGCRVVWSLHPMEHELSAFYDVPHGAGLAVLIPYWLRFMLSGKTAWRFVEYGVNVWGIDGSLDEMEVARRSIEKTKAFFDQLGMPTTLRQIGIMDDRDFAVMAKKSERLDGAFVPLSKEAIVEIFRKAL
jgi:alcohol dehydrogenase YqhD (iron-dependent ADH family)